MDIEAFCLFDRDYRCEEEITEFIKTAHDEELVCRVLAQKELENYLLVPEAIRRAIWRRVRVRKPDAGEPTSSDVAAWLDEAAAGFKMLVIGQRAAQSLQFTKSRGSALDPSSIISRAAEEFARLWDKPSDRLRIVPGKEVLSRLNEILQRDLSISLTNAAIAEQLNGSTIDASLLDILRELDQFCSN